VLRWGFGALKLTLGLGSLGLALMLSHWRDALSIPGVLVLSTTPLAAFVFAESGTQPARVVRITQVVASIGYLGLTCVLLIVWRPPYPNQTIAYVLVAAGAIPCGLVLLRALRGETSEAATPPAGEVAGASLPAAESGTPSGAGSVARGPRAFPLSVSHVVLTVVGSAAFVALGVWLMVVGQPWGLACLSFVVPMMLSLRRLADPAPALEVTYEGIVDRTPLLGVGLIRWSEMSGVAMKRTGMTHHLSIGVHDPDSLLARVGTITRLQAKLGTLLGQGPVLINLFQVGGRAEDVWASIEAASPRPAGEVPAPR
jgi:hypothetical protein